MFSNTAIEPILDFAGLLVTNYRTSFFQLEQTGSTPHPQCLQRVSFPPNKNALVGKKNLGK